MDNLSSHLTRVYLETRKSQKTGNDYTVVVYEWFMPNDKTYKQEKFVSNEEIALIEQSVSTRT